MELVQNSKLKNNLNFSCVGDSGKPRLLAVSLWAPCYLTGFPGLGTSWVPPFPLSYLLSLIL